MKKQINYEPLNRGVLIKVEEVTESGIIKPDSMKDKIEEVKYELLKCAEDCIKVKEGMIVNFRAGITPTGLLVDGEKYMLLFEYDVLGIYSSTFDLKA